MAKHKVRIIPLGGLGEIGKNMTVFEYGNEAFVIDTGIMFPANDMHGVDYIIPDFNYLIENKDLNVRAIFYTHGHEDHIGAVNHVTEAFPNATLYATQLTAGLIEVKAHNSARFNDPAAPSKMPNVKVIKAGDKIQVGPFTLEPFRVTHSIPDCVGYAIDTPQGLIVHTGDYKFDNNPVDGRKPDYARMASFGERGVKLLMGDSTNADKEGWTESESLIEPAFEKVFKNAKGRIMVATFASLISRVQQVANVAKRYGRKMVITGFTMREYVKLARKIGYLDIPEDMIVDVSQLESIEPHKVVLMVTGSQGEPSAVLGRLSVGRHRFLDIQKNDTIILSSHPIPGNEESVYRTIDRLIERGANVIYEPLENVHVSGHGAQEEMKLMLNLIQPTFVMPIHGEVRHLHSHARLAIESGIPESNIIISENGTVIEMDKHYIRKGERVPGGYVFVDGSGVGDVGRAVIRDREILARDGFLIVNVNVNKNTGKAIGKPEIISRGFVYLRDADDLMLSVENTVKDVLDNKRSSNGRRASDIEDSVSKLLYNETRRRPMVFSVVNEV
ncbi:MAG: ribonuclease J [Phototrophicaceae bacterium]